MSGRAGSAALISTERLTQVEEDRGLVDAILAGEARAFERLHDRYRRRVYAYCRSRLSDPVEAEDVTQEVFLQVHRSLHRFEGRSTLLSWMLGIALNQLRRRWRRVQQRTISLDEAGALMLRDETPAPDRVVEAVGQLRRCDHVLSERVAGHHRQIFSLRYEGGYGTREIARRTGKSNQAIKMSLYRSRRVLIEEAAELTA